VANSKPKRILGCSPEEAWRRELAHLRPLPTVLPPVYDVLERVVDLYGFVSVDTNRDSAPERLVGRQVTVLKYHDRIEIHHRGAAVATHRRLVDQRDARQVIDGHHTVPQRASRQPPIEVQLLRGEHEVLQRYAKALAQQPSRGLRALRRLLQIKRTYPREPFLAAWSRR
jgi:Mu transposase-like protein